MPRHHHILVAGRYVRRALFQRHGSWCCYCRDTVTGKTRLKTARATSRQAAEQEIQSWLEAVAAAAMEPDRTREFCKAFEEFLALRDVREVTRTNYRRQYELELKPAFQGRQVDSLRLADVEAMRQRIRARGCSACTVGIYTALLRRFYTWAIAQDYADRNPTAGLKIPVSRTDRARPLTVEEARQLLAACHGHLYLAVALSLYTGLRSRNVRECTWRHVDLARGKIVFSAEEMKARRPHEVPIHPVLEDLLRAEAARQPRIDLNAPILGQLFANLKKGYKAALKRAGLEDRRWHDLRVTCATWLEARTSWGCLQAILAHSPQSVTDRYISPAWEARVAAIRSLPDLRQNAAEKKSAEGS